MDLEIEAKIKLDSHEAVRRRLKEAGAVYRGVYLETNRLYDLADRSLTAAGCGLRVRSVETLEGEPLRDTLTYKGPRRPGEFKVRPEIEVGVEDAARTGDLLTALGYRQVLLFQKRRERWRLGDTAVELDEVPELGRFVEIEGPDRDAVARARELVGLDRADLVPESYVALLAARAPIEGPATFLFAGTRRPRG